MEFPSYTQVSRAEMTIIERRVAGILLIAGLPLHIIAEVTRPLTDVSLPGIVSPLVLFILENLGAIVLVAFAVALIYGFWRLMGTGTRLDLAGRIGLILVAFGASTFLVGNLANTIVMTLAEYTVDRAPLSELLEEGVDAALQLIIFLVHVASTQGLLIGTLALSVFLAKRMATPFQIWFARVVFASAAVTIVLAFLAPVDEYYAYVAMATLVPIWIWYMNLGVAVYRHGDGIVPTLDEGDDATVGGDLQVA